MSEMITLWLVVLIVSIGVEVATLGLTSIWFAGGAVVAVIVAAVLKLKSLEAFEKVADGQATTILLPAELQGIASIAETFKAAAGKKAE